jgi:hypothetical protein
LRLGSFNSRGTWRPRERKDGRVLQNETPAARVLIYQGKKFLWFNPTIEADSTLIRSDLSFVQDAEITAKPNFSSATDAQKYVNEIREVVDGN